MITDLWIENFKGIGKRQHIPLRPVTLLFGRNSAGKSTVLHALLYLREIICKQNVNPTKPLEGEQSVNLGGFLNLLHKPAGPMTDEALDLRLGCKITQSPGLLTGSVNISTQYAFFSNDTAYHGYRWNDPETGDSYLQSLSCTEPEEAFTWACDPDAEIHVTIRDARLFGFNLSTAGEHLLTIHVGCWINIWHPQATGLELEKHREICRQKIEMLTDRLRKALFSSQWQPFYPSDAEHLSLSCSSCVLTLPTVPKLVSGRLGNLVANLGGESWPRPYLFTLSSFLHTLECNDDFARQLQIANLDGAFVAIDVVNLLDASADVVPNITVGVRSGGKCELETAIELIRLACLMEAPASCLSLDRDFNGFPTHRSPSLKQSDIGSGFIGMSLLGPSSLLKKRHLLYW